MPDTRRFSEDEIFDAFALSEGEREFVRSDADRYRRARERAEVERVEFLRRVEQLHAKIVKDAFDGTRG